MMRFSGSFPRAPLAQLDRATDYESVGRPFESGGAHHFFRRGETTSGSRLPEVSAEVADGCEHHRTTLPQPAQLDLALVEVAQLRACASSPICSMASESYLF